MCLSRFANNNSGPSTNTYNPNVALTFGIDNSWVVGIFGTPSQKWLAVQKIVVISSGIEDLLGESFPQRFVVGDIHYFEGARLHHEDVTKSEKYVFSFNCLKKVMSEVA